MSSVKLSENIFIGFIQPFYVPQSASGGINTTTQH